MALTKTTHLECFFIRGDGQGGIQGAHVEYLEVIKDGDTEVTRKVLPATPVALLPAALAPILNDALAAALTSNNAQVAEIEAAKAAQADAEKAREQTLKDVADRDAQLAALTKSGDDQLAQIAALTEGKAEADAGKDKALADLAAATAQIAQIAQIAALTDQLTALQPPADVNGVPQVVTMVQAQLALLGAGLLDTVEAAIKDIPGDQGRAAQIEWSKAANVHRDHALIAGMQQALGLTDEQIDALFVAAAKL